MKQLGSDALHPQGAGTDRAVSDRPAVGFSAGEAPVESGKERSQGSL